MRLLRNSPFLHFTVATFVVMAVTAVVLIAMVTSKIRADAVQALVDEAVAISSGPLLRGITPADLEGPMTGARYDEFDHFVRQYILSPRIARVKVWAKDGTVVYSDDPATVGKRFPDHELLLAALGGQTASMIELPEDPENQQEKFMGTLNEVYTPIIFPGETEPSGAFEVYQYYEPTARLIRGLTFDAALILAAGFIILYGLMLGGARASWYAVRRQQREREQAEKALKESEERYRIMLELGAAVGEAVVMLKDTDDKPGVQVFVSDVWPIITGYTKEELLGMSFFDLLHPEDRQASLERHRQKMASESLPGLFEMRIVRKDGTEVPIELTSAATTFRGERVNVAFVRDITERKKTEEALRESEARFRGIFANIAHPVVLVDPNGHFLLYNARTLDMLGYTSEELSQMSMLDVTHPDDAAASAENFIRLISGEVDWARAERRYVSKDGSVIWGDISATAIPDSDGTVKAVCAIVVDITEHKHAMEMLKEAKQAAEAASDAKTEFISRVSHEVRTPIHSTMGMIELALDTDLTEEQREYLSVAMSSARSLLTVINDVLDFSKIGARQLSLEELPFDLRQVMEQTVEMVALRAHQKGLELVCHFPPEVPTALVGDAARLRQVLLNLVSNAVKFTPKGEVVAGVQVAVDRPTEVDLHFTVRDTGIGIEPEKIELIFEPFRQADGTTTREYGGTGLGLTISKQLVELMHGHMWVESRVNEGSTFHFTVTCGKQSQPEPGDGEAGDDLRGVRALVVDDNKANRDLLLQLLAHWGLDVTEAEDGPEALRKLEAAASRPYDLVLLDATMPGSDGFAVAEQLRSHVPADRLVMMLTTDRVSEDTARCRQMGALAHLVKPVKQSALLNAVSLVVQARRDEGDGKPAAATVVSPFSWARILVAEDNAAAGMLAKKRLEMKGFKVQLASNGREALEMLEKGQFDLVVMDVEMPEMNGLEATRAIRKREAGTGKYTGVIAMTAYATKADQERCREAGMDAYIPKPVNYEDLYREIESLLARRLKPASPVTADAALKTAGPES